MTAWRSCARRWSQEVPHLAEIDEVPENEWRPEPKGKLGKADSALRSHFYLTNPIARASQLMAELSAKRRRQAAAIGAWARLMSIVAVSLVGACAPGGRLDRESCARPRRRSDRGCWTVIW